ncbi:chromosome partitioning protein [Allocatelliglobosispora scoriae]|uniref:Chromosome partitioning protein n=1 Tax=Allocatelliglobosispora scoriae TaxID=643052 RepID=A0A841BVI5_9ACTN|nr:AAA family ATPase [Allocatelliglobosispora scoriae]MBB5873107.1 chromosome partitioning protein [Allocatelliglobosispora scoriae]
MQVVSVINYKGGVGKTTITANLGAELARRGMRVLLIDLDPQTSLTFSFVDPEEWRRDLREARTVKRWFDSLRGDGPGISLSELIITPQPVNSYIADAEDGRLDLIASHLGLINIDLDLARGLRGTDEERDAGLFRIRGALAEQLHHRDLPDYDLILIDCPPTFNIVTQSAIIASDQLIIPAKADFLSTLGIDYLYGSVDKLIEDYNADARRFPDIGRPGIIKPDIAGVAFTMIQLMYQRPIAAHADAMSSVRALGLPVFPTAVREAATLFAQGTPRGVPAVLRERANSPAADELRQLTAEVMHALQPGRFAAMMAAAPVGGATDTVTALRGMSAREDGAALLHAFSLASLRELAAALDMSALGSGTRDELIERIVERTIGSRLNSEAIRRL